MNREGLLSALLWSAGGRTTIPEFASYDIADLVDVLSAHKMVGRFVERIETTGATLPTGMLEAAQRSRTVSFEIAQVLDDSFDSLVHLVISDPDWDGSELIRLKGNAAATHLGDPSLRRPSSDLDLLARDPKRLARVLQKYGFETDHEGICHEEPSLRHPLHGSVDNHRYFRAWRYWDTVSRSGGRDIRSSARDRTIFCSRLKYDEIRNSAVCDATCSSASGLIPGPVMAAIILCFHLFADYIEPPFTKPTAKVRLVELCEFRDLVRSDLVADEAFFACSLASGAEDAVLFAVSLCRQLGLTLPEWLESKIGSAFSFPRELARGIFVEEPFNAENLLIRADSLESLVDVYGSTTIVVPEGKRSAVLRSESSKVDSLAMRWPSALSGGPEIELHFWATGFGGKFIVGIDVVAEPGFYKDELTIATPSRLYRAQRNAENGKILYPSGWNPETLTWLTSDSGWSVRATIEVDSPTSGGVNRNVPLVIAAHRFTRPLTDDWNELYTYSLCSVALLTTAQLETCDI